MDILADMHLSLFYKELIDSTIIIGLVGLNKKNRIVDYITPDSNPYFVIVRFSPRDGSFVALSNGEDHIVFKSGSMGIVKFINIIGTVNFKNADLGAMYGRKIWFPWRKVKSPLGKVAIREAIRKYVNER